MRMITANISVTALATITGILLLNIPNNNQANVPGAKSEYMNKEMPAVFFVRMVFNACGKKEAVVKNAATNPRSVMLFMHER
jgi:hypothetical protein